MDQREPSPEVRAEGVTVSGGGGNAGDRRNERRRRWELTMSDRTKARIGVLVIVALLGVLAATQPGCGTMTVRYDSSGKHPDTRK